VRVTVVTLPAVEHASIVSFAIVILVFNRVNASRNTESYRPTAIRIKANRNVQVISKGRNALGAASLVEIGQDFDGVASRFVRGGGIRIFARLRDPKASLFVEGHIHRLADVWFGSDELDFETGRQVKALLFQLGRERVALADELGKRVIDRLFLLGLRGSDQWKSDDRGNKEENKLSQQTAEQRVTDLHSHTATVSNHGVKQKLVDDTFMP